MFKENILNDIKLRGGDNKEQIVKMIKIKNDWVLLLPNKKNKKKLLETLLLKVLKDEFAHRYIKQNSIIVYEDKT